MSPGPARDQRALTRLRSEGSSPEAIDQLLRDHRVPLVEGTTCTFLWRGDAEWVGVEHRMAGVAMPLALRRLKDTDLWYASVELPRGARIQYRILVRRGENVESMNDPLNPRVVGDAVGSQSVLEADGYITPEWTHPDPSAVAGELVDLRLPSRALRREAHVTLYIPSRMRRDRKMPLLVVHDGGDFLNYSSMGTVLDNLMHRRLMADCVVAFTHPGDRLREYAASPAHSRFLTTELVPHIEGSLRLRGDPRGRALMGASFGGVAALSAAVRAPGFYGALLLESPSLRFTEAAPPGTFGDTFEPVVRFVNSVRARPKQVTDRVFLTFGAFEPLAVPDRAMVEVLRRMCAELRVVEGLDGHNWINWRDRLLDGLGWLFPGEARLIYPP
ncbi:MAG: alpha/beta hydrolase-fold protein [Candidatus Dormiibacterota bacterium]